MHPAENIADSIRMRFALFLRQQPVQLVLVLGDCLAQSQDHRLTFGDGKRPPAGESRTRGFDGGVEFGHAAIGGGGEDRPGGRVDFSYAEAQPDAASKIENYFRCLVPEFDGADLG